MKEYKREPGDLLYYSTVCLDIVDGEFHNTLYSLLADRTGGYGYTNNNTSKLVSWELLFEFHKKYIKYE